MIYTGFYWAAWQKHAQTTYCLTWALNNWVRVSAIFIYLANLVFVEVARNRFFIFQVFNVQRKVMFCFRQFYIVILTFLTCIFLMPTSEVIAIQRLTKTLQSTESQLSLPHGNSKKRDRSLIFPVKQLLDDFRHNKSIVLIDVRKEENFSTVRVPGSINIPLYAVKTKKILKDKTVILLNEGYNYDSLENECKKLQENGFSAKILEGGLTYWRDMGGVIEGDFFAQDVLNKIPPQAFFADRDYDDWLVVNVEKKGDAADDDSISFAAHIPYTDTNKDFATEIERMIEQRQSNGLPYLLIVDDNGENYSAIKQVLHKAKIANVYYLQGGLQEYKNFLQDQTSLLSPSRKSIKKCESCP